MELARLIKPGPTHIVRLGRVELPWVELDATSGRVAALLRCRGIEPGERVAVMLAHVAELPGIYFGVLRAGAVVVPVAVDSTADEVTARLRTCEVRLVFAWHECLNTAEAGARAVAADYVVVHPGSFRALLDEVVLTDGLVERTPEDEAVVLFGNGDGDITLTFADLTDQLMPLTSEEDDRC